MDINIKFCYRKKGVLGLSDCIEEKYIKIHNSDDKTEVENALNIVKQGFKALTKKDLFSTDLLISESTDIFNNYTDIIRVDYNTTYNDYTVYRYNVPIYKHITDTKVSNAVTKKDALQTLLEVVEIAIYK